MTRPRAISLSFALILITIACGIVVRFAHLGLPAFIMKYGGSMLWALTIYWVLSTLLPWRGVVQVAIASSLIATAVEFLKLYRNPNLDAFRKTLPGVLLLGRYFSVWDIVAYVVAIAAGALVDRKLRRSFAP